MNGQKMTQAKHPAKFHNLILQETLPFLIERKRLLDPMAGVG